MKRIGIGEAGDQGKNRISRFVLLKRCAAGEVNAPGIDVSPYSLIMDIDGGVYLFGVPFVKLKRDWLISDQRRR
ncbi:MAG: hypothetical protein JXR73_07175 [Candidatus Omnitrophica bacterium]|nr:hypothetical protein [Candidatus Omnitrophota bacterium]